MNTLRSVAGLLLCQIFLVSCAHSPASAPSERVSSSAVSSTTSQPIPVQPEPSHPTTRHPTTRHPTLLCAPGDLAMYSLRTGQAPWKAMVIQAVVIAGTPQAAPSQAHGVYARALRNDLNAATIAWLSAPQDTRWREALVHALAGLPKLTAGAAGNRSWDGEVHTGNTLFTAMLALDLAYSDLSPEVRGAAESAISQAIADIKGFSWSESAYALRGTWALYHGDRATLDTNKRLYRQRWEDMITADGVFIEGPAYALARMSTNDREQKYLFMDILAINGEDDWYHDPRMVKAYRWLWAYATTVSGNPVTFGDSAPGRAVLGSIHNNSALLRTGRFDQEAAQWAYRLRAMNSQAPEPQLTSFLLMDPPATPSGPQHSGIYPNGGAWLTSGSAGAVQAALWNPRHARWHNHQDVNAIQVSENGTPLLRNVGYAGANRGVLDRPWAWVNNTAESSNVLLADGPLHAGKIGAGLSDSWIEGPIQFATGNSGPSQSQLVHQRTLIQIAQAHSESGYWIVWDHVTGKPGATVSTPWHPASSQTPTHQEGLHQWNWNITEKNSGGKPQSVTVRLLSEPSSIVLKQGAQANWGSGYADTYLYPSYPIDERGLASFATCIYGGNSAVECTSRTDENGAVCTRISDRKLVHDQWWQPSRAAGKNNDYDAAWFREKQPDGISNLIVWNATAWAARGVTLRAAHPVTLILTDTGIRLSSTSPTTVSLSGIPGAFTTTSGESVPPLSLVIPAGITRFNRSTKSTTP